MKELYQSFKVIRESGLILERKKPTQEPIQATMSWHCDLGWHEEKFALRSFQSSIVDTYTKGATEIYNYTSGSKRPRGDYWWLCLNPSIFLEKGKFGGGSIGRLDSKKVDEFKKELKDKHTDIESSGDYPTLEEILEFGTDLSNWYLNTSSSDLGEVKDGRKYNVHMAIYELGGKKNYEHVPLTRKNIRLLNASLKPTKAEEITDEDVKKAVWAARERFVDKDHNYGQMIRALQSVGFTDLKTMDYGDQNDYGEKYIGQTLAKYKGNPVLLDTSQCAFGRCNVYPMESRVISKEKWDELNRKYPEFKGKSTRNLTHL